MIMIGPDRIVGAEMNERAIDVEIGRGIVVRLHAKYREGQEDRPTWQLDSMGAPALQFLDSTGSPRGIDPLLLDREFQFRLRAVAAGTGVIELGYRHGTDGRTVKRYRLTVRVHVKIPASLRERPTTPPRA